MVYNHEALGALCASGRLVACLTSPVQVCPGLWVATSKGRAPSCCRLVVLWLWLALL